MLGPGVRQADRLRDRPSARTRRIEGDTSIGSLQFMSPEQLHGEALSPASDLFSLGVVLYEALTGRMPYDGGTPEEVSAAQAAGVVRPPSALPTASRGDWTTRSCRRCDESQARASTVPARWPRRSRRPGMRRRTRTTRTRRASSHVPGPSADRASSRASGYIPPPAPAPAREQGPRARPPPARCRGHRRAEPDLLRLFGTLLVLAGVGLVVAFVILPLLDRGWRRPTAGIPVRNRRAIGAARHRPDSRHVWACRPRTPSTSRGRPASTGRSAATRIRRSRKASSTQEPPADARGHARLQVHDVLRPLLRLRMSALYSARPYRARPGQSHEGVE